MAALSVYLSPFAPDYSGVSTVLFDLKTVTAMHDASGCTGNYTGYDEPRWYGSKSPIFCSGLREIDAILGDDEKLIQKMLYAAKDLKPEVMALVGSPVPMVIGSDMVGIAEELQERSGIPCLGFDTTGTAYYDKGVAMATIALLKKFTKKTETVSGSVNILGANPLDFATGENLDDLKILVEDAGYKITASLSMGYNMDDLKKAASTKVNLAVSKAGYLIAEYMQKVYGIPYVCGLPVGEESSMEYLDAVRKVAESGESVIFKGTACEEADILIVGEQVQSNALRIALEKEFGEGRIAVGCIFGKEDNLSLPQDVNLASECQIKKELNKKKYRVIIADPFMEQLLSEESEAKFCANAQYAVSSKVCVEQMPRMIGEKFNAWYTAC